MILKGFMVPKALWWFSTVILCFRRFPVVFQGFMMFSKMFGVFLVFLFPRGLWCVPRVFVAFVRRFLWLLSKSVL